MSQFFQKGLPVRLDIDSIECEDPIDREAVAEIVELAIECGILYPPIVVQEIEPLESYLLLSGANTLGAARKLKRKEGFDEQVECYMVESPGEAEALQKQMELADEL